MKVVFSPHQDSRGRKDPLVDTLPYIVTCARPPKQRGCLSGPERPGDCFCRPRVRPARAAGVLAERLPLFQRWCGQDRNLHRHWQHAAADKRQKHSQRPGVPEAHQDSAQLPRPDWGEERLLPPWAGAGGWGSVSRPNHRGLDGKMSWRGHLVVPHFCADVKWSRDTA